MTRNRMFQMKTSISCRTIGFWHLLCTCYSMFASLHFNQAALTQFSIAKFTTLKAAALLNQICKDRVFFCFCTSSAFREKDLLLLHKGVLLQKYKLLALYLGMKRKKKKIEGNKMKLRAPEPHAVNKLDLIGVDF